MLVHKNVLSKEILEIYHSEIEIKKKESWLSSSFVWDKKLAEGITGLCLTTPASPELHYGIESSIKNFLPDYNKIVINHCVWHPYSGIAMHPDGDYKFGATLYMNKNWDVNFGGIFIWKDQADDMRSHLKNNYYGRMNALCPTYNTLVVNTNKSFHMVTLVSPLAPENRFTLQIWGE